jgi:hypothetical protein
MNQKLPRLIFMLSLAAALFLPLSCARLGWGMLLWSSEDPPIPSGTILPVHIRSNIDQVWVVGIPEIYRTGKKGIDKMEIPLAQFELAGSKGKARKRAEEFSRFALSYAETLQDGLPIRENPDNSARRVYRLRTGEIIKILAEVKGNPAISASGDPLPGSWYQVLTEDGSTGYCFSYRLKIFEHYGGPLAAVQTEVEEITDPDLENLLAKTWSPESYGTMVNNRRIDLEDLSRHWRFDPGQDTGIAHIYLPGVDQTFSYTAIRPAGSRTWRFEGSSLQMNLRADTTLAVQYIESGGASRTLLFVALPAEVEDLILQESARRENLFLNIYRQGPAFTSNNYGTIVFTEGGEFNWTGFTLLVPQVIPLDVSGTGTISMDLFLSSSLQDRYNGAFTFRFNRPGAPAAVRFMYTLDSQGFRLEYVPESGMENLVVSRRAPSPMVLYFFKAEEPAVLPQVRR